MNVFCAALKEKWPGMNLFVNPKISKGNKMENLKSWVLEMAGGEPIEAVIIGTMGWDDHKAEINPLYDKIPFNKILTWEQAAPFLDYNFNAGYGAPECNALYAYTKTWVIAIYQYDGSTNPYKIPRSPMEIKPQMVGG